MSPDTLVFVSEGVFPDNSTCSDVFMQAQYSIVIYW